jgi:hypothetical protein
MFIIHSLAKGYSNVFSLVSYLEENVIVHTQTKGNVFHTASCKCYCFILILGKMFIIQSFAKDYSNGFSLVSYIEKNVIASNSHMGKLLSYIVVLQVTVMFSLLSHT